MAVKTAFRDLIQDKIIEEISKIKKVNGFRTDIKTVSKHPFDVIQISEAHTPAVYVRRIGGLGNRRELPSFQVVETIIYRIGGIHKTRNKTKSNIELILTDIEFALNCSPRNWLTPAGKSLVHDYGFREEPFIFNEPIQGEFIDVFVWDYQVTIVYRSDIGRA